MFQPAEETGAGAAAVVADPRYAGIKPDWAFSLHNIPGIVFGAGMLGAGPANCASRGMEIRLTGSTAHASRPGDGRSPMKAMSELMPALEACGSGGPLGPGFAMVTVTHASMGAPTYGVAPGEAKVFATLRTTADEGMATLMERAEALAGDIAARHGLACDYDYSEVFLACTNDPDATTILQSGMERSSVRLEPQELPLLGSEDFGRFGLEGTKSAMVFLGTGADWPQVHTPEYDFRDELIPVGIRLFSETLAACMENG